MKSNILSLIFIILGVLFLFGCTSAPTTCGDLVCQAGEELTCPTDCAEKVDGEINVYINGAYDSDGDIYLYWHKSSEISTNISANITSQLAEHWSGSEYKNLYLSFNDTDSGEIPVDKYGDRTVTINNLVQGEYYFEARTDDYEYRAVSEKVLVKEDGTYNIYLDLVPANPAVRIKARDYDTGKQLFGEGKIEIYAIEEWCEYGECNNEEWLYSEAYFKEGQEINGLFFLYQPRFLENRNFTYLAKVTVEGYDMVSQEQLWTYDKYQERNVYLRTELHTETGNLEVTIVPGYKTTLEDINSLEGVTATIHRMNNYSEDGIYSAEINNGKIYFEDILYGEYLLSFRNKYNYNDDSIIPITNNSNEDLIVVNASKVFTEAKALKGLTLNLSVVDEFGELIPNDDINIVKLCVNDKNQLVCEYTENNNSISKNLPANPLISANPVYDEEYAIQMDKVVYTLTLNYDGMNKDFVLDYEVGIHNEIVWQFTDSQTVVLEYPKMDGNPIHLKLQSVDKACELLGYPNSTGSVEHCVARNTFLYNSNDKYCADEEYDGYDQTYTITYGVSGSTSTDLVKCSETDLWSRYDCRYVATSLTCTNNSDSNFNN